MNTSKFIERASALHNSYYDYSNTVYVSARGKVKISCPEHGEFQQAARKHLEGQGCAKCAKGCSKTTFIRKAKDKHGDRYNYSSIRYINSHTEVSIICPIHGVFNQKPSIHIRGSGCPKCASNPSNVFYIWNIKGTDHYKIGVSSTNRLKDRIARCSRSMQVGSEPVRAYITPNPLEVENYCKKFLQGYNIRQYTGDGSTEVFKISDILSFIKHLESSYELHEIYSY